MVQLDDEAIFPSVGVLQRPLVVDTVVYCPDPDDDGDRSPFRLRRARRIALGDETLKPPHPPIPR